MDFKYGLKEVADVVFYNLATGKPELFFDTLKVSTIENESESAEARGGQGNPRRISWDYGRTSSLTMQDALISDKSLSLLAGTQKKNSDIRAYGREILTVTSDVVELSETPVDVANTVTFYNYKDGILGDEVTGTPDDTDAKKFDLVGAQTADVMVFYQYEIASGATQVTFTGRDFPANYRVVGDVLGRGQDGLDRAMQFVIPVAKLQSSFSLTMDVENVSTFDFNLDVMTEAGEEANLYHIIHFPHESDK